MKISVTGHARSSLQPELATLHLQLGFESNDKQRAVDDATQLARTVAEEFKALAEVADSGVAKTTLLPLGVRSWRPWADGKQQPMRHAAFSPASVTFDDFGALSAFVDRWSRQKGVQVGHVEWELTDESRDREQSAALTRAVADAHAKALTIAHATGEPGVTFLEIADHVDEFQQPRPMMAARMAMEGGAESEGVDLTPADIEVEQRIRAVLTTD